MLSIDLTIIFFPFVQKFNPKEAINHGMKIRAFKVLHGHKASVQSVAAQTSGEMVLCFILFLHSFPSVVYV